MAQLVHPVRNLLPQAMVATFGVVIAPALVTLAMVVAGLPQPEVLLATLIGIALSCAAATVGAALWVRRPESIEVAFGELMLWRWFRRSQAEATIHRGARLLHDEPAAVVNLSDQERLDLLHELTAALEVKDPYTSGHSKRVEKHAYRTGLALGLSGPTTEELRLAAALHDVGKIKVPDRILRKPGSLTDDEVAVVRGHVDDGAGLVSVAASASVVDAIRYHHERWDGRGYPAKLSGEEIPLFARIIAVVDAYDAITSARPYKAGTGRRDAVEVLTAGAGNQFDPQIVKAFVSTLSSTLPIAGLFLFLFAAPARAARQASAWAKGVGAGSVASGVGTVGMTVILGTTGISGAPQSRPAMPVPLAVPAQEAAASIPTVQEETVPVERSKRTRKVASGAPETDAGVLAAPAIEPEEQDAEVDVQPEPKERTEPDKPERDELEGKPEDDPPLDDDDDDDDSDDDEGDDTDTDITESQSDDDPSGGDDGDDDDSITGSKITHSHGNTNH